MRASFKDAALIFKVSHYALFMKYTKRRAILLYCMYMYMFLQLFRSSRYHLETLDWDYSMAEAHPKWMKKNIALTRHSVHVLLAFGFPCLMSLPQRFGCCGGRSD